MKNLINKVVVITGAGSGMGRAYAHAFSAQGCKLALCDLDSDGLTETVAQLDTNSADVFHQSVDGSDHAAHATARRQLHDWRQALDGTPRVCGWVCGRPRNSRQRVSWVASRRCLHHARRQIRTLASTAVGLAGETDQR